MFFQFDSELARLYGVDEAIFIHNLYFWLRHNEATGTNIIEYNGEKKVWSYHSMNAYQKVFPFWNRRQIRRIVESCRAQGLLITAALERDQHKQTLWYTLDEKVLAYYKNLDVNVHDRDKKVHNQDKNVQSKDNIKYNKKYESDKHPHGNVSKDAKAYGPHKWIYLTDHELDALIEDYGEVAVAKAVQYIDISAQKTGNRNGWCDWELTIRDAINRNWGGIMDDIR